jgi:hypothetical protein
LHLAGGNVVEDLDSNGLNLRLVRESIDDMLLLKKKCLSGESCLVGSRPSDQGAISGRLLSKKRFLDFLF